MSPCTAARPAPRAPRTSTHQAISAVSAPANRFPESGIEPRHAYTIVHDDLMLEGNPRLNLATFCTTWLEPETRALLDEALDNNIVDKDEYPQTAEIEARCMRMLADLWNAPGDATPMGTSTTGSSEAAMLAGLAAKRRWRDAARGRGEPADSPNLVSGPVQVCWEKFARYFDVELREAPMTSSSYVLRPNRSSPSATRTPSPSSSPSARRSPACSRTWWRSARALDDLERAPASRCRSTSTPPAADSSRRSCAPELAWDFRLPRVKSINASGHKTGLAPLGMRLGALARGLRSARGAHLRRQLPRRRHPDLQPQLLPSGRAGGRAVLQVPAARPRGLCAGARRLLRHCRADRRGGLGGSRLPGRARCRPAARASPP